MGQLAKHCPKYNLDGEEQERHWVEAGPEQVKQELSQAVQIPESL